MLHIWNNRHSRKNERIKGYVLCSPRLSLTRLHGGGAGVVMRSNPIKRVRAGVINRTKTNKTKTAEKHRGVTDTPAVKMDLLRPRLPPATSPIVYGPSNPSVSIQKGDLMILVFNALIEKALPGHSVYLV